MELTRLEALAIIKVTNCALSESRCPSEMENVITKIKEQFKDDEEIQEETKDILDYI